MRHGFQPFDRNRLAACHALTILPFGDAIQRGVDCSQLFLADLAERLGADAARPHRVTYRKLTRD